MTFIFFFSSKLHALRLGEHGEGWSKAQGMDGKKYQTNDNCHSPYFMHRVGESGGGCNLSLVNRTPLFTSSRLEKLVRIRIPLSK